MGWKDTIEVGFGRALKEAEEAGELEELSNLMWSMSRAAHDAATREKGLFTDFPCPKCGGEVGHRVNCPDGIATTKGAE